MKTFLTAAFVAAAFTLTGCGADPVLSLPTNHPAHADAQTPPLRSQVTALDAPTPQTQVAATSAGAHDAHAHHDHAESTHAEAEAAKKPAKPYPLDVCLVADEKLGGHGAPFVFEHEGQEIKLCCKMCLKDFQKEPAVYLKKLEAARSHQHGPSAQQGTDASKPHAAPNQRKDQPEPGAAQNALDRFFTAYLAAADLLARDDFEGAARQFDTIHRAGHRLSDNDNAKIAELGDRIGRAAHEQPKDIKALRASFKTISPMVVELTRIAPPSPKVAPVVREAYCSMAKAPWLQTGDKVANPYFGAEMPNCGNITRTINAADKGVQ